MKSQWLLKTYVAQDLLITNLNETKFYGCTLGVNIGSTQTVSLQEETQHVRVIKEMYTTECWNHQSLNIPLNKSSSPKARSLPEDCSVKY